MLSNFQCWDRNHQHLTTLRHLLSPAEGLSLSPQCSAWSVYGPAWLTTESISLSIESIFHRG